MRGWLRWLVACGLGTVGAAQEASPPAELEPRFEALAARDALGTNEERGAALVALGPDALPFLVGALERRPRDGALRHAARGFGRTRLAPWWAPAAPAEPADSAPGPEPDGPRAGPRATLACLAEVGGAGDLELAMALSAADSELAVSALTAILAREPEALAPLAARVLRLEAPVATCLVRAVGALRSDAALQWLGALLAFQAPELELGLLSAIEACARGARSNDETRREVREHLWSDDPQVLRKAAATSALLQDDEALERLVDLLEHPTDFVAASALRALRTISGRSFPAEPETWQRWLERENAWFERHAPYAFADLVRGRRDRAIAAARQLAQRRVQRRGVSQELGVLLESGEALLRRAGCEALGQLGLRDAIPLLVPVLSDEDPTVAESARRALARLGS